MNETVHPFNGNHHGKPANGCFSNSITMNAANSINRQPCKTNDDSIGRFNRNNQNKPMATGNEFLTKIVDLIVNETKIVGHPDWVQQHNPKVINFKQPAELEKLLNLKISTQPQDEQQLYELCQKLIEYSPKTNNPLFCNQLYAGVNQYSLAGSWLTDALNTSQATYETSPVFTLMEREVIKYLGSKCGWNPDLIDGIFSPGGSIANMNGIICARQHAFPEVKQKGVLHLNQLVLFASDNSHYSFVKGAIWMGLGTEAVIKVQTDDQGRMRPDCLRQSMQAAKNKGQMPFMVACTSGTTVYSAFDPLDQIRQVCDEFGVWMHVDSALGGTVLFSPQLRHLMKGIELADSVTWNLHKMAGAPMQCSAFLTRHPKILTEANGLNAEYLFQSDKYYDASYDSGDKSLQCGRRVDSLKLWLHMAACGEQILRQTVEDVFEQVQWFTHHLSTRPRFRLVLPHFEGNTVCFWYVPKSIEQVKDEQQRKQQLHLVCPNIKRRLVEEGTVMINYQPLTCKQLPNFFRMVITCVPAMSKQNLAFVIDEIDRVGQMLYPN